MSSAHSRSSVDPVAGALSRATAEVLRSVAALAATNPVVLIDGRSGAGKSTLARLLVAGWPLNGRVQLIALDSLYPGWDGLEEGVRRAQDDILLPHARGLLGVWQRWDWERGATAEAHAVDPSLPLIVEGAGIVTPRTARVADVRVWLESPPRSRKDRALRRDGDLFRPHWDRWARQEEEHIARDDPRSHATHVLGVP